MRQTTIGTAPHARSLTPRAASHYMSTRPNLHLRGFRKRSGLTQLDVARLLGYVSSSPVSRLEAGEHAPDLRAAFMLETVFAAPASQIFREIFALHGRIVRDR